VDALCAALMTVAALSGAIGATIALLAAPALAAKRAELRAVALDRLTPHTPTRGADD
jgi:hypothetical protein